MVSQLTETPAILIWIYTKFYHDGKAPSTDLYKYSMMPHRWYAQEHDKSNICTT